MREAMLYEKLDRDRVRCHLCAHRCVIGDGKKGVCHVRENRGGILYTLVYGRAISQQVDPVEKKPLYHFYPGSFAYSIATPGCNFRCPWCQNWEISQMPRERYPSAVPSGRSGRRLIAGREAPPEQIVASALETGSRSIAYTYTEPTIFFEYARDAARLAHNAGIANIFVTNGYMSKEMLEAFQPYLDAANVDLKAFRKDTYRRTIGAGLQTVLDNLRLLKQLCIWLEVTTLVIPGVNDDPSELRDIAQFILRDLGANTPWHISRFFPTFKMIDRPPTPLETLRKAYEIGLEEGLHYVYMGNVAGESNTTCHHCGEILIRRVGYCIAENRIRGGKCPGCESPVAGVWTS